MGLEEGMRLSGKTPAATIPVSEEKPKAVIETTKNGRPTIKVETPKAKVQTTETKEKTFSKVEELKVEEKPESTLKVGAPIKTIGSTSKEIIEDAAEAIVSGEDVGIKIEEKAKKKIEEKEEKAKEKLLEAVVEGEKQNARMASAAGKAPVDSPFKRKLIEGITNVTGKAPGRTTSDLLDAVEGLSRGVLTASKSGKNLRLAGTAALLSVSGFALGKKIDSDKANLNQKMDSDKESELRKSLMSDG